MIKCPNCGASHYSEGPSECTAVYYPPIWKNGINVNPDRNVMTTYAHCCECHYDFVIKRQGSEIWTELGKYNPPTPVTPVFINGDSLTEYVPIEKSMSLGTAVIDNNGNSMREKTKVEKDIEEINKKLERLTKMVESLWEWNTHDEIN